jgi:hypothetical protein
MTTPYSSGLSPELLAAAQRAREHWVQRALVGAVPPMAPSNPGNGIAPARPDGAAPASAAPPQDA